MNDMPPAPIQDLSESIAATLRSGFDSLGLSAQHRVLVMGLLTEQSGDTLHVGETVTLVLPFPLREDSKAVSAFVNTYAEEIGAMERDK